MNIEWWLTFALAAGIVLVVPGPTILLVVSQAAAHGRRSVVPLVAGVTLGDLTAMGLSLAGLGAVMAASAALFGVLKWAGAAYLIFLGVRMWRTAPDGAHRPAALPAHATKLGRRAFIVTALNPKSIAFFVAFLPQFVAPGRPALPQMVVLAVTFLTLAALNAAAYALLAGRVGDHLQRPGVRRWFARGGGSVLIGAGLFTAALRRTA